MRVAFLSAILISISGPACNAQSIMEAGGVNAGAAGLGAGLAASASHGRLVNSSYNNALRAQQALAEQTKAIEANMKVGCSYEAKKQWENAEQVFKNALKIVAMRDGPGSPKSVPVLRHLVTVTKAQDRLDDAIGYQKLVVAFDKAEKSVDVGGLVNEQIALSKMMYDRHDYTGAEPVLSQAVEKLDQAPNLQEDKRYVALVTYARVLHNLHKDRKAEIIEVLAAAEAAKAGRKIPESSLPPTPTAEADATTSGAPANSPVAPPDAGGSNSVSGGTVP